MKRTGPSPAVRRLVLERDGYLCQFCGRNLEADVAAGAYSLQHRRARGMGGTSSPEANSPSNLILLCGSATTGCHGYVEQHRAHSQRRGFTLLQSQSPADVAVQDWTGRWWWLNPDGSAVAVPPAGVPC